MSNKWFLVEGFTDKGELLRQSGIASVVLEVSEPRAISGISFSEDDRAKALQTLGIEGDLIEFATDNSGVFYLGKEETDMAIMAKKYEVAFGDWGGDGRQEKYRKLIQSILTPVIKKKVAVRALGRARTEDSLEREWFHILIWSTPMNDTTSNRVPEKIWGRKVSYRDGFNYSGEGLPIENEDGSYVVAEVADNRIYILYNMPYGEDNDQYAIFEQVLRKAADHLGGKSDEIQKAAARWHERLLAGARDKYADMCLGRFEADIKAAERTITQSDARVAEYQAMIVKILRECEGARRQVRLLASLKEEKETYLNEYDRIAQIPGLKSLTISDEHITFCTDRITIFHEGVEYDIGEFRVRLGTKNASVNFSNLTNKGNGPSSKFTGYDRDGAPFAIQYNWHHPHVKRDGSPCLGNIGETIGQLVGEHRYSVVIQLLIQFLRSVNVEDGAGKGIFHWPKVEKKAEEVA